MIDYIIIGSGLAGISFAETALLKGKTIFVVDAPLQNSSKIAAGLYNPVILKRFSKLWQAQEQLDQLKVFYAIVEAKLGCQFDFGLTTLRKFHSVEEQNNWFIASDQEGLSPFLSTTLVKSKYAGIDSPHDYGEVLQTGYVNVALLLQKYAAYLRLNGWLLEEVFDYGLLERSSEFVQYKNVKARHIIFAEGFGLHSNPFFNHLPLDGTKGELFIIKAPHLRLDVIVNTNLFILPLGDDYYKVGATYNWYDKTDFPTEEGKQELLDRIREILTCDFEVVSHLAGVRPTVKDRKPLLGTHPIENRMHILNGLGTRGVMLGPSMALKLFETIELEIPLDAAIDIRRFNKRG